MSNRTFFTSFHLITHCSWYSYFNQGMAKEDSMIAAAASKNIMIYPSPITPHANTESEMRSQQTNYKEGHTGSDVRPHEVGTI